MASTGRKKIVFLHDSSFYWQTAQNKADMTSWKWAIFASRRPCYTVLKRGWSYLVKGRAYKYKAVVTPVLEYASSSWHLNNIKLINHLESVQQKAAWWTPQRCCRISNVNNILTTLGWPYLQHRCRKARLVNTRWLSQYHKSPSFPFPVIPSAHLSSVVLATGSSPFPPKQSRIEMTSLRMWLLHPPLRLFVHVFQNQYLWSRPCPQVSSVDDG